MEVTRARAYRPRFVDPCNPNLFVVFFVSQGDLSVVCPFHCSARVVAVGPSVIPCGKATKLFFSASSSWVTGDASRWPVNFIFKRRFPYRPEKLCPLEARTTLHGIYV